MSRSREEAERAGVKVRETQHSMKRRKPWHNYHRKGTYMLTMVVEGRRPLLGRLVIPAGNPAGGPAGDPAGNHAANATGVVAAASTPVALAAGSHIELTALGRTIRDEEILKIHAIYKGVEVWKLCIMPDHLHIIVRISEDLPVGKHLGDVVAGFKGGCTRAWWRTTKRRVNTQETAADSLPPLFERGYNDLILLESGQLDNWKRYLDDNPRRLAIKRLRPDYFTR